MVFILLLFLFDMRLGEDVRLARCVSRVTLVGVAFGNTPTTII